VAWLEHLKQLASICPELNMADYSDRDVDDLNCWAIEVATCIDGIATPPAAQRQWVGLTDDAKLDLISDAKGIGGRVRSDAQLLVLLDMQEAKLKEQNT
jgi:hypothetical protein